MKNILFGFLLVFTVSCASQRNKSISDSNTIRQEVQKMKGKQLVLKKVTNESRCPEGVHCIWIGEVEILLSLYKNNKWIKDKTLLISPKTEKEYLEWFSTYYSKTVTSVTVIPYPKEGVIINQKEYYIKIN
ncbi:hypothetical protein [Flavobacterium sp.]|uniref:hypothetical protein n=1 Tax=Flavobacterium sp. TaxID=239 RepID=UPI00286E2564|nr:hypothetical protein [Flavobacterium sp.]